MYDPDVEACMKRMNERLFNEWKAWIEAEKVCDNPKRIYRESFSLNFQICGKCPKCIERKSKEIKNAKVY